jgi:hypothetical protein
VLTVSSGLTLRPVVSFLVEPENQGGVGFLGLGLKTDSYGFSDLGLKINATIPWFRSLNQADFGLLIVS